MGVEVAGACFHWSQSLLSHHPSTASQTLGSSIPSLSSRGRRGINGCDHALAYHNFHQRTDHHRSPFLGAISGKVSRTRSLENPTTGGRRRSRSRGQGLRRAFSATLESFGDDDEDDEEFFSRIQELATAWLRQESSRDDLQIISEFTNRDDDAESSGRSQDASSFSLSSVPRAISPSPNSRKQQHDVSADPPWPGIRPEWPDLVPASVERKANSVDLPLSLRIIKRRKRCFREAGDSACSSVKKAFSSMVFIIREIQRYTLQMREVLFYENLQGILGRVQGEMHASFVWLFEHIFSCTPTLMVYLMLLLANFSVSSMAHAAAIAAAASPNPPPHSIVTVVQEDRHPTQQSQMFDPSSVKMFSVGGRTASVGGGGGGKLRPAAGATDDDRPDGPSSSYHSRTVIPEGIPSTANDEGGGGEVAATVTVTEEDEARLWNSIVEEASRMQATWRDEALMDPETLQRFVSPFTVELEAEYHSSYSQTELMYQQALSQDPDNSLLLSNFAQFLYLVLHDHDRAEHHFKLAVGIKPVDAESLSRYASFLWLARHDLGAAEETYLEAIAAEPSNTFHAANYAHFLWTTGGEDTCYPLDGGDTY